MTSQAYVFLTEGDFIQAGDEFYSVSKKEWSEFSQTYWGSIAINETAIRRKAVMPEWPSARPSEADAIWHMYAAAVVGGLYANPDYQDGLDEMKSIAKRVADAMTKEGAH